MPELKRDVPAVAEGFVPGTAAAAEGDAVADLIERAVGGLDLHPAFDPERAARLGERIFHDANGRLQFRLQRPARLLVPGHQTAGGALTRCLDRGRAELGDIRLGREIPGPARPVAEARARAEAFYVGQFQGRALIDFGLGQIGLAGCGFGTVEGGFDVGLIAVRLIFRETAAAQCIGILVGETVAI
jgi:hypothetical protein